MRGQDTIFLRSGFKSIVFVKDISENEVEFKKFKHPKGITYCEEKKNIVRIAYSNGIIDSLMNALPASLKEQTFAYDSSAALIYSKGKMLYKGRTLKDKEIKQLLELYPEPHKRFDLLLTQRNIQKIKIARISFACIAFFSAIAAAETLPLALSVGPKSVEAIIPIIFSAAVIGSVALTVHYSIALKEKTAIIETVHNEIKKARPK